MELLYEGNLIILKKCLNNISEQVYLVPTNFNDFSFVYIKLYVYIGYFSSITAQTTLAVFLGEKF